MNVSELARKLRVTPEQLREKLPGLGFAIGKRAIKIDNRVASQIMEAWGEMRRRERLTARVEEQKAALLRKTNPEAVPTKEVTLPPIITVRDFATRLDLPVPQVMRELMSNGILAALNERIDFNTAAVIAEDLGFKAVPEEKKEEADDTESVGRLEKVLSDQTKESMLARPPVVVVMGHVDHGKTKLLDAIRRTHVMESEAGGITQHIGAYTVERRGRQITFIDTPGHEAFTVMRSRGAKVADIAILVVAADDGVQPQTKEAVNIIKSANLPFIVALNKIDRPDANIDRVKGQLSELKLVPEDWGGDTVIAPVSAKEGKGLEELLDVLLLVADMHKETIAANPNDRAIGTVIESHLSPNEGPVATVLVQNGTLRVGDDLGVRGFHSGRVRAMRNWAGKDIKEATPSMPAKIIGWKNPPAMGDIMEVPQDVHELKKVRATDISSKATEEVASIRHLVKEGEEGEKERQSLNVIIRTDVLGSLEAILGMFDTIKHPDLSISVNSRGLGNITDSDILNAQAGHAIIYGFNVRPTSTAEQLARDKKVSLRLFKVIYKLFDDVLSELQKLLPSETVVTEVGKGEILAVFRKAEDGWIVGVKVKEGKIVPRLKVRLARGTEYVSEGEVLSLQMGKSEAKEIKAGQECGLRFKSKAKPEVGDMMEFYSEESRQRLLQIEGISKR